MYCEADRPDRPCTWLEIQRVRIDGIEKIQAVQEQAMVRVDLKIDGLKNWIMGATLSAVLALLATILNLLKK